MIFRTNFRDLQADAGLHVDQSLPGKLLDGLAHRRPPMYRDLDQLFFGDEGGRLNSSVTIAYSSVR